MPAYCAAQVTSACSIEFSDRIMSGRSCEPPAARSTPDRLRTQASASPQLTLRHRPAVSRCASIAASGWRAAQCRSHASTDSGCSASGVGERKSSVPLSRRSSVTAGGSKRAAAESGVFMTCSAWADRVATLI
jgi:hypothetical protein